MHGANKTMRYELTFHAMQRMQQRGKSAEGVKVALRYGRKVDEGVRVLHSRDALRQIARRRAWIRRLQRRNSDRRAVIKGMYRRISVLENMRNCAVVIKEGRIVTVYKQTRKRRH